MAPSCVLFSVNTVDKKDHARSRGYQKSHKEPKNANIRCSAVPASALAFLALVYPSVVTFKIIPVNRSMLLYGPKMSIMFP